MKTKWQTETLFPPFKRSHIQKRLYFRYVKRALDFICSSVALIVLSPLLLVIAILVRMKLGSPILFQQPRPGKDERLFVLYKFRTMTDKRDKNGILLPDSDRLKPFGQFLRSTSLDELPELFNILKGDMSVVGPRPLLIQYLSLYDERQKRRHEVRPGLSGLAQVNGRNAINWNEKFEYDVEYVDGLTFLGDCKVVLKTFVLVFQRKGICSPRSSTMEPFEGNGFGKE